MLYLITAASHIFYALIWLFPKKYNQLTDLFNLNTFNYTKSLCILQKIIQIIIIANLSYNNLNGEIPDIGNILDLYTCLLNNNQLTSSYFEKKLFIFLKFFKYF